MKVAHRCQNCFLTHLRKYLKTSCFKKGIIFYLFSDFDLKCLLTLYNDLSAGLPKVHLALLGEHFAHWKICFGENTFSDVFLFGSTVFQNVCEKFRAKLLKIPSRCRDDSVELFCFKKFLSSTFVWLSTENLLTFQKLCLSNLQLTFPEENVFEFIFFGKANLIIALKLRPESHRNFEGIFCAWLSKLPLRSLEEDTDENCFW